MFAFVCNRRVPLKKSLAREKRQNPVFLSFQRYIHDLISSSLETKTVSLRLIHVKFHLYFHIQSISESWNSLDSKRGPISDILLSEANFYLWFELSVFTRAKWPRKEGWELPWWPWAMEWFLLNGDIDVKKRSNYVQFSSTKPKQNKNPYQNETEIEMNLVVNVSFLAVIRVRVHRNFVGAV